MIKRFRKHRLAFITVAYWFLLIYIIVALVWWFIALEKQNGKMFAYRKAELNKDDPAYLQKKQVAEDEFIRKTTQYIGEGATFFLVIILGAVFVYRAVRKQIRLSQQQQNFMMAVTHELKTPIAVTKLNLETMQKRKLDEQQQQKLIQHALQEIGRLNELTNNILVASQLDSGNYRLNKQSVDLGLLVQKAVQEYGTRFPQRQFSSAIAEQVIAEGEATLLRMLVNNLLENAVKYSGKDKPVQVSLKRQNSKAILSVADEGQGIKDEEKEKVFQKFYRAGDENIRSAKGTGLGLYLCKRIVHDHKGTIGVTDNTPNGAVFTVTLQTI